MKSRSFLDEWTGNELPGDILKMLQWSPKLIPQKLIQKWMGEFASHWGKWFPSRMNHCYWILGGLILRHPHSWCIICTEHAVYSCMFLSLFIRLSIDSATYLFLPTCSMEDLQSGPRGIAWRRNTIASQRWRSNTWRTWRMDFWRMVSILIQFWSVFSRCQNVNSGS